MNDEMGKAAHVGVGRLLRVGGLDGVHGHGCLNNARGQVLRYLSVCSGIEAATVAWGPLGWKPVAFSEVERFPCAVLAHHYPDVPNLGDMTKIDGRKYRGTVDLLVGGTPCQDFSVAGKRAGLSGERSGLALDFIRLAREITSRWILWENVPGCLSTNGGIDFGYFAQALAECGYHLAYRILDAQFFGVPQRRRRVFLVGYFGDWRPPVAVLFEPHGLRRDTSQGRKTRHVFPCLTRRGATAYDDRTPYVLEKTGVRIATPKEWERLFGFPDDYTLVHYKGKPAADSPRYKALGNSIAVPVMRWIGERIQKWENMYADGKGKEVAGEPHPRVL